MKTSGAVATVLGLAALWLIVVRRKRAAWTATVVGLSAAVGVSIVHLPPRWSTFSDAFPGASGTGVNALSWIAVLIEIGGALLLGIAGAAMLARRARAG